MDLLDVTKPLESYFEEQVSGEAFTNGGERGVHGGWRLTTAGGTSGRWVLWLALIVAGGAALRVAFFTGYHGYDDRYYIERAVELASGQLTVPASHWAARLGIVGPTALVYAAFGISPATTVVYPFACSLLSVVAAAVLGRRLRDARAGLIAAFMIALFPMEVLFASMLFATAPLTLFAGVALVAFVLAERDRRPALYVLSGASMGLAGLVHEAALVVLVVVPVYMAVFRRLHARQFVALVAFAGVLALDPLIHGVLGDPAAHLAVLGRARTAQGTADDVAYRGVNFWWIAEPIVRLFAERTFGVVTWVAAPVVALRLVRPAARGERELALLIVVAFLWISYGTVSLTAYAPLARLPRYLAPIVLPMLLLVGGALAAASDRVCRLALAAFTASGVVCLLLDAGSALPPYERLRDALAAERPARVVVERGHRFALLFAEGFAPPYSVEVLGDEPPRGAVVVVANSGVRNRVAALPGAVLLAEAEPPETLYLRLIRTPLVARVLRMVRPGARMDEYRKRAVSWRLSAYRVP